MAVNVKTTILIDRSPEEVAAFAMDPEKAPQWYVNIQAARWRTDKPIRPGSLFDFEASFLGKKLSYTYEVTEYVPGEKMVMRTAQGPFPMETEYLFERIHPGLTRMYLSNRGEPTGFSRWFAPFMSRMIRKANEKDLKLLKKILEAG
jgi:uncharacterized protein YndB with AHSA1/START domain